MLPFRLTGRRALMTTLAATAAMAVVAPSAMADRQVALTYTVNDLPAHGGISVFYDPGTTGTNAGGLQATSGSLYTFNYFGGGMMLFAADEPTDVIGQQVVTTNAPTITGRASVPTGTTVTVQNSANGQTTPIPNGSFSIPLGAGLSATSTGGHTNVACPQVGDGCRAIVNLAGGAQNRHVTVTLPNRRLGLVAVTPPSRRSRATYTMSAARQRGSRYRFVLNATGGYRRGAHLTLRFAPTRRR